MSLNKQKGNMYGWVTHTWNTVKGRCPHDCPYCYMKRFKQGPLHFDNKELKTNLGAGNVIFVGSSCDMWAAEIPDVWIWDTLKHCRHYGNRYLFQSKNPERFWDFRKYFPGKTIWCTTIETNRNVFGNAPTPKERAKALGEYHRAMVTIEPIMDFDMEEMVELIRIVSPVWVNIGSDSGGNRLPEPGWKKVQGLIARLNEFAPVQEKQNLKRLSRVALI